MANELNIQIPQITQESLERLYILNDVRNILLEESSNLMANRVMGVLGFGSTISGLAEADSDVDICFIVKAKDWEDPEQQIKREDYFESILKKLPYKVVKPFYGQGKPGKAIHLVVEETRANTLENPSYISDYIILWRAEDLPFA